MADTKDILLKIGVVTDTDKIEVVGKALDDMLGTYEDNVRLLSQYNQTLNETSAGIKALNKAQQEQGSLSAKQKARYEELIKLERETKQGKADLQIVMKNQEKLMQAENGSMKQQSLMLGQLRMLWRGLTDEQKAAMPQLKAMIDGLDKSLKSADADIGNFQRNVGNYPQLMQQILPVQGQFSNQLMQMAQSAGLSTGALGALGAALGVGALAYKGFQQAMDLTQTVGDEVAIKMAGWEAVWDKFIRTIVSGDFTNFIQGLRDAKQAGEELTATLDELFERNNALRIAEAEASLSQEKNLQTMRDQTKSIKERKEAGEAYIETERKLAKVREDIARQEYDAQLKNFAAQSGMSEADAEFYIKNYNKYREALNSYNAEVAKANEDIKAKQEYADGLVGKARVNAFQSIAELKDERDALINNYSDEEKRFIEISTKYNNTNDQITSQLVNSWVNVKTAIANGEKGITRAVTTVSGLTKQEQALETKKAVKAATTLSQEDIYKRYAYGTDKDMRQQVTNAMDDIAAAMEEEVPKLEPVKISENGKETSAFAKLLGVTPEEFESLKSQALSAAQSIFGSIQQLSQQATQQRLEDELEAVDKEAESEKAILKSKLDKNLISQKQYEKKLAEVDAEAEARREELNKEAFKKNKAWNIGQALMNMALAITNIWATNKGGAAARIAETVIATTTGLAQVAAIAAQKYARGGELHGASHAQGGIKGNVQGHNIELEGEEVVINKRSARKYRNALSWINSDNGWGVDFAGVRGSGGYTPQLKFARGGVLNSFDFSPSATPTSSSVQQAISKQASRVEELIMATNRRIDRLQVQVNISDIESASDTKHAHISRASL